MSSGTTGVATVGAYTERDLRIWGECFARGIEYVDGGPDDICHVCYGYGLFTGGLVAHYGCISAGCTTIPMSAGNTERQIRVLKEMGSTIICCTPSYAMHIADTAIEMGVDPCARLSPEGGHPWRRAPSRTTSAPSSSASSTTGARRLRAYRDHGTRRGHRVHGAETACTSPRGPCVIVAEIIGGDPSTGEVLPDGEWGELVLTTVDRGGEPRRALPHTRHHPHQSR